MVNPSFLCRKHLLGEHGELHKFLSTWRKRCRIDGRVKGNAIEPESYQKRHDELAKEMVSRGYNHNSPCEQPDWSYLPETQGDVRVNTEESLKELVSRCPQCKLRTSEAELTER